jgi:hypothetical protein
MNAKDIAIRVALAEPQSADMAAMAASERLS